MMVAKVCVTSNKGNTTDLYAPADFFKSKESNLPLILLLKTSKSVV